MRGPEPATLDPTAGSRARGARRIAAPLVVGLVAACLAWAPAQAGARDAGGLVAGSPSKDASPPPPAEYRDLWAELEADLASFERAVDAADGGREHDLLPAAELLSGNGNRGMQLVRPGALIGAEYELGRLHGLGVRAVTLAVGFPLLSKDFHDWTTAHGAPFDRAALVDFYRGLVGRIRARGMKVAVEAGPLFPGVYSTGSGFDVGAYYRDLIARGGATPGAAYAAGRAETIRAIVSELRPDYLSFGSEPDTEAELVGLPLASPATQRLLIEYYLDRLSDLDTRGIALGAGIGTWQYGAEQYVSAYCATGIDFFDLHLYPIRRDFAEGAITLARAAHACGKRVTMTEAWLLKSRHGELGQGSNAVDPTIFARDVFSSWAPLDSRFLRVADRYARALDVELLSPFWSKYFWAYLDYDQVQRSGCGAPPHTCSPAELLEASSQAAAAAILSGRLTPTGRAWAAIPGPTRWPQNRLSPGPGDRP